MRWIFGPALLALTVFVSSVVAVAAQTSCAAWDRADPATAVFSARRNLMKEVVARDHPAVPLRVASELDELKRSLAAAADNVFLCAAPTATAERLQGYLAAVLQANLARAVASVDQTRDNEDRGAYGSDLAVQVEQISDTPKLFLVDFRYGIECGDDHLLLVFGPERNGAASGFHERLRWSAPGYSTVADALGDFVLLTPLTGSQSDPKWRFVVAHGHPTCGPESRPSRFDLDLLRPTDDPVHPAVDWHFEHAYRQDRSVVPRLSTTEDTIEFRLTVPLPPRNTHATTQAGSVILSPDVYRFRLTSSGQVEPVEEPHTPSASGTTPHR